MNVEMLERWCKEMIVDVGKHRDDCKDKKYFECSYHYFCGYIQSLEGIGRVFLR